MKLLFDNNLSLRLLARLQDVFTDSQHVAYLGLDAVDDAVVWQYALEHNYCIVTKDADFNDLSVVRGSPPKVLWLKIGNCSTHQIETLLRQHVLDIQQFIHNPHGSILVLI